FHVACRHQALPQRPAFSQISLGETRRPRGNHAYDLADVTRARLGAVSENGDDIKIFATLKRPGVRKRVTSANGMTAFVPKPLACGQIGTVGAGPEAISGGSRDAWIFQAC